jgi:hypothetical protein
MIKSRMMRWTGHIERMREVANTYRTLVVKPAGKIPFENADGRIILKWMSF